MRTIHKYQIIESILPKFTLKVLCKIAGVSASGYYCWKNRELKDKDIEKWISVHGIFDDSTVKLQIKNSTDTAPQKRWKKGLSTKHSGNGIGLRSVRAVVEKYNGIIDIIDENNCFSVSIIISFQ